MFLAHDCFYEAKLYKFSSFNAKSMWEIFKSIFRKKEQELPKEEITLEHLENWLDEKTKPVIAELNGRLAAAKQKVIREIAEARHNIEILEQAQLRNQEIPERAKHFMKGNRETYVKRINFFFSSIHFPDAISDYGFFYSAMQEELRNLAQGVARPYQILQEFFSDESRQVSSNVAVIEQEINGLQQEIISKSINSLESTKLMIKDLESKICLKKKAADEAKLLEKEKEELDRRIEALSSDITLLKKDKKIKELEKRQLEIKVSIEQARARIMNSFSVMDTAMRKFEKITYKHRVILQKYIESPFDALLHDLHLEVIKAFSDLQAAVRSNKIDLKDRKREKTLEAIQLFTKEYLGNFLTEYGQLKKEECEIEKAIACSDVSVLLKEKQDKILCDEAARKDAEKKIADLQKELEKIDIGKLKEDIACAVSRIVQAEVSIKF